MKRRIFDCSRFAVVLLLLIGACLAQTSRIAVSQTRRVEYGTDYHLLPGWAGASRRFLQSPRVDVKTHSLPRIALRVRRSDPESATAIRPLLKPQPVGAAILEDLRLLAAPQFVMAAWVIGLGAGLYLVVLWMASYKVLHPHGVAQ